MTTLTAYQQLVRRTDHPVLQDILHRIAKDERRHFAFYRAQAKLRLERSARARALTRWVMRKLWTPVGVGVKSLEELAVLVGFLFGDDEGRRAVDDMDRTISALPGLHDLHVMRDAARAALATSRDQLPITGAGFGV